MLDHVFTDAIGALRDVFENNLLERQAFEERFQADVLLGDLTWQTSYGLPGEGLPPAGPGRHHPRVADLGPDGLPLLVHRRGVRRGPDHPDRDRPAHPAPLGRARPPGHPRRPAPGEPRHRLPAPGAVGADPRGPLHPRPRRPAVGHRGQLRGPLPARQQDAGGRLRPRRGLRRHGRLDRRDPRAPGRPATGLPARRGRRADDGRRRAATRSPTGSPRSPWTVPRPATPSTPRSSGPAAPLHPRGRGRRRRST